MVLLDAPAHGIVEGEAYLGRGEVLLGRLAEPVDGLCIVALNSIAALIAETKTILCLGITLLGGLGKPVVGLLIVACYAKAIGITCSKGGLCFGMSKLGSLLEVRDGASEIGIVSLLPVFIKDMGDSLTI